MMEYRICKVEANQNPLHMMSHGGNIASNHRILFIFETAGQNELVSRLSGILKRVNANPEEQEPRVTCKIRLCKLKLQLVVERR